MTQETTPPDPRDVRNAGKPWSEAEAARLQNLGIGNTPMRLMVRELGRPEAELRAKAEELGFPLETDNYNRFTTVIEEKGAS